MAKLITDIGLTPKNWSTLRAIFLRRFRLQVTVFGYSVLSALCILLVFYSLNTGPLLAIISSIAVYIVLAYFQLNRNPSQWLAARKTHARRVSRPSPIYPHRSLNRRIILSRFAFVLTGMIVFYSTLLHSGEVAQWESLEVTDRPLVKDLPEVVFNTFSKEVGYGGNVERLQVEVQSLRVNDFSEQGFALDEDDREWGYSFSFESGELYTNFYLNGSDMDLSLNLSGDPVYSPNLSDFEVSSDNLIKTEVNLSNLFFYLGDSYDGVFYDVLFQLFDDSIQVVTIYNRSTGDLFILHPTNSMKRLMLEKNSSINLEN